MGRAGRTVGLCLAAFALVVAGCARLGPNEAVRVSDAPMPAVGGTPTVEPAEPLASPALSDRPLSAEGAVVRPLAAGRTRPLPADESCPALADPGFTARCGIARAAGGPLVWLTQTRNPPGRGVRAQVLRPDDGALAVVLEAVDDDGSWFDDARGSVADLSGDGNDEIALSFYRRGAQQVLSVDLVGGAGEVVLHRDYVQGSVRASAHLFEGWEAVNGRLVHERITFEDGAWRRSATSTAAHSAVYGQDFADPFLLRTGNRYYGYSTNRGASNVPLITSTRPGEWDALGDALPQLPPWTNRGRVWAPSVLPRPGGYVLYYATREVASGLQCLSRASSLSPAGPFGDDSAGPLVCQRDRGGSIDPSPFVDRDGRPYLLWKSEGTGGEGGAPGGAAEPARLWSQELAADGLSLIGAPTALLAQDRDWELPTIEGPAMVRDGERLYLFYSAGRWQNTTYAVGWAACATVTGPCTKAVPDAPLLASAADGRGPGGPGGTEVVVDPSGGRWLAYHAWVPFDGGYPAGRRMLHLTPLWFEDGRPVLGVDQVGH